MFRFFRPLTPARRFLRLVLACALGLPAAPGADRPTVELTATDIEADAREQVARGNARLRYGEVLLTADEVRYDVAAAEAFARGDLTVTFGAQRILAEAGSYRPGDGRLVLQNFRFGRFPFYVRGGVLEGTVDALRLTNAALFYGEPNPSSLGLRAETLEYLRQEHIRAEQVTFRVGPVPVFYLPRTGTSFDEAPADFNAGLGYRGHLGAFVNSSAVLPIRPGIRIGLGLDGYTRRGFLYGPLGSYVDPQDGGRYAGSFQSGYIRDTGPLDLDRIGRPVPADRGFFEWHHRQEVASDFTLQGHYYYWSDSEVTRDFRPRSFRGNEEPDSYFEGVYLQENFLLSALVRVRPNRFQIVPERLPEIRFDLPPTPFGPGIYHRLHASAAHLREEPLPTGPRVSGLRSDRFDLHYGLTRPVVMRPWLTFSPVAGGRLTHYRRALDRSGYTRALGEAGFDLVAKAHGIHPYANELWNIDGLRHLVTAGLQYRYVPEADRGRRFIPRIDRRIFTSYLRPLGLADIRHIDDLREINTLRLRWDNRLQTRHPQYGARDLLAVTAAIDAHLSRRAGAEDFSDAHLEVDFTPIHWLRLDAYSRFSSRSGTLRETSAGLAIEDGNAWQLRLGTDFLEERIHEYRGDYRLRLNEIYDLQVSFRYDADARRLNEQRYGLRHNVHNSWVLVYETVFFSGPRREGSFQFNVSVGAVSF